MDFDFMAIFVLYFAYDQKKIRHFMKQNGLIFPLYATKLL